MLLHFFRVFFGFSALLSCVPVFAQVPVIQSNDSAKLILVRSANGMVVTATDVLADIQLRVPPNDRQALLARPDTVKQIASNLLVRRLLAAEAERDGLPKQPLTAAVMNLALDRVLSDARLAAFDAQNEPAAATLDARARLLYQAAGQRFETPAQSRASHILIENKGPDALKRAQDILAQLRAGASFAALAKANSADSGSAAKGGDLGFFGPGKMVRPFEDAVNALSKPGDLSEPVESQFGYHIIRLDERKAASVKPFEDVRTQLLSEARTSILNSARVEKVQAISNGFAFDQTAIDSFAPSAAK